MGAPLTFAHQWWSQNVVVVENFRQSFLRREALGDAAAFGDWLARPDCADPQNIATLLKRIDHPLSADLGAQLERWSGEKIDERKLAGFGRFWSDDDWVFLVEPAAWRGDLDRAEKAVLAGRSVLVCGDVRGGKSAFLKLLGARLKEDRWRVFEAGAAELMAGQMYFGQLEGRLRETAAELNAAKRVAWCVGDMGLFAESGSHQNQPASALDQVMPNVTAGRLVLIGEGTREGVARLLQGRPSLRNQVEVLRLEPMDDAALKAFAQALRDRLNAHSDVKITPAGAEAVLQLARQYFTQQPSPGVLADLMKRALQHAIATDAKGVDTPEVIAALSQITGLPQAILDDRDRLDLKAVREYFAQRVIGQDEAVNTVVDRIAMLKAGLVDPQRPVGVFFFAGPTGTGKTELAKTLAEFLFGSPERMARLDMSEFQSPDSVVKIVGERGRSTTDSLVERIRKQPFSVILLDEFEKAHANIWDLFLQVFDDGRLTDANGHVADFRHSIIILTSNLGAISHRSAGIGFNPSKEVYGGDQILKAVMQAFRPEFVNRLDKVVVFQPLSRDLMRAILAKELAQVLERRGLRNRDWAVEWEASALDFLLDRGFSAEMGARPLKRAIDQHLLKQAARPRPWSNTVSPKATSSCSCAATAKNSRSSSSIRTPSRKRPNPRRRAARTKLRSRTSSWRHLAAPRKWKPSPPRPRLCLMRARLAGMERPEGAPDRRGLCPRHLATRRPPRGLHPRGADRSGGGGGPHRRTSRGTRPRQRRASRRPSLARTHPALGAATASARSGYGRRVGRRAGGCGADRRTDIGRRRRRRSGRDRRLGRAPAGHVPRLGRTSPHATRNRSAAGQQARLDHPAHHRLRRLPHASASNAACTCWRRARREEKIRDGGETLVARVECASPPAISREDPLPAHLHAALMALIDTVTGGHAATVTRRYREVTVAPGARAPARAVDCQRPPGRGDLAVGDFRTSSADGPQTVDSSARTRLPPAAAFRRFAATELTALLR